MTDTVHLDSLSVVLRFTLIQLALMDPTELMGVMQQGHTGARTHSLSHTHTVVPAGRPKHALTHS